ncbi:hypothetical protein AJ88_33130 [Mesorhizobium amorphae CCBAU 01583]|nr:hypothetical protein AJ88_33130 [Mesorhizobium amorphae CCBAU 01583]
MIPLGIIASQAVAGGGGGSLPPGAIAHLDFRNAFYYSGGAEQAVSALLGGDFDAGAISSLGMRITPSNGNRPKAIGVLLSVWRLA